MKLMELRHALAENSRKQAELLSAVYFQLKRDAESRFFLCQNRVAITSHEKFYFHCNSWLQASLLLDSSEILFSASFLVFPMKLWSHDAILITFQWEHRLALHFSTVTQTYIASATTELEIIVILSAMKI